MEKTFKEYEAWEEENGGKLLQTTERAYKAALSQFEERKEFEERIAGEMSRTLYPPRVEKLRYDSLSQQAILITQSWMIGKHICTLKRKRGIRREFSACMSVPLKAIAWLSISGSRTSTTWFPKALLFHSKR